MEHADVHRLQFAFTIVYHYLFPQLTMGLSLLIFLLKSRAVRGDAAAAAACRFWLKIFGVSFVMGVITGIPMEFQFGTNWARFSAAAGGVIGQTLAMEGLFAFFLESSFLYLLLFEEKRLGPRLHWGVSLLLFIGTWLSGFFIVATNAWMQHPVGYRVDADGVIHLESLAALFTNRWLWPQYAHTMLGSLCTASFVMASIGSFYVLRGEHTTVAGRWIRTAIVVGAIACAMLAFPTGDMQARLVYERQPATFAAMEGHFHTEDGAGLVLIGQPNMETLHLDNPVVIPKVLSFMTHQRWHARVLGLTEFPVEEWPTNVPMLYYAYHIMAGLGTCFGAIMAVSLWLQWRGRLLQTRWMLWTLMLSLPLPFIANTAGWLTAETGRQPWVIYGLMRTDAGFSQNVSSGNVVFSLLGFAGMYALLSVLYLFVMVRLIAAGPESVDADGKKQADGKADG